MPAASARLLDQYGRREDDRAAMARGLAFLFGAGATLVFITLALPHSTNTQDLGVAIPPTLAYIVVLVLMLRGPRLPVWGYQAILAVGAVLIAVCVRYGGDSADAYALMFVWVTLYAGYFFALSRIVAFIALCGVCYAGAQVLRSDQLVPHVYWLMAIGTASVAAALIGSLTHRLRGQATDLAAVAQVANGLVDVGNYASMTCHLLRNSTQSGAVVLLEADDEGRLHTSAFAGSDDLHRFLCEGAGADEVERCLLSGEPSLISGPPSGVHPGRGGCLGLVQPILRDGVPVGVIGLVFARPRHRVSDRVRMAAELFAAEASIALERRARLNRERERRALEINDNVVQGLALAKYALEVGQLQQGVQAIDDTLERAREIMTSQLEEVTGSGVELRPGDLVRRQPGSLA